MKNTRKITVPALLEKKQEGRKIACLTAYDFALASLLDKAGVDLILVGDSGAMVAAGCKTTLPATMEQMVLYTQSVARGVANALIVADMPFLSYQASQRDAVLNAGRFIKEGGADAVKLEGGRHIVDIVRYLVQCGIPVMGHLGLTPQSVKSFGGYGLRGAGADEAEKIRNDAIALQDAGVFSIVLEKIPADLAEDISRILEIPTIGIGAGPSCDGQILVTHDILGLFEAFTPKFARRYAELAGIITEAVERYCSDVKQGSFPSNKESY